MRRATGQRELEPSTSDSAAFEAEPEAWAELVARERGRRTDRGSRTRPLGTRGIEMVLSGRDHGAGLRPFLALALAQRTADIIAHRKRIIFANDGVAVL